MNDGTGGARQFSLQSVCWGYRDIFRKAIEGLVQQGYIGTGREEVTERFFDFLNCSDRSLFDHVVKELLEALGPETAWILDVPAIFEDILDLAARFSERKLYYGINYFRILGEGGFGDSPNAVRHLMSILSRLAEESYDLAFAFLRGYGTLLGRLRPREIDLYVDEGRRMAVRSTDAAARFLQAEGRAAENTIQVLTREARLSDAQPRLERVLRALAGREIEIHVLSDLDADELLERGSRLVGLYRWIYVPERIRFFPDNETNRDWYLLQMVAAAASVSFDGFAAVHGHGEYESLRDLRGNKPATLNVLMAAEYCRIISRALSAWPGSRGLFRLGLQAESEAAGHGAPESFILDSIRRRLSRGREAAPAPATPLFDAIVEVSESVFETAAAANAEVEAEVAYAYPGYDGYPARALAFMPDPLFPVTESAAPPDSLVADLKQRAEDRSADAVDAEDSVRQSDPSADSEKGSEEEPDEEAAVEAVYLYDEWNQKDGEYLPDYCKLRESAVPPSESYSIPEDLLKQTGKVRRVFEMLKPAVVRKEKYLEDGTEIDTDILIDYLVSRTRFPSPPIRFYQRPRINRRDLAVVILLDVSGSTGEENEGNKILTVEKHAAIVLGHGLHALDDRFEVCGFSGNGREDCRYFVYKDLDDHWDSRSVATIMGAYPVSSTRIGPALRHSGYRLEGLDAKQKLVILITDGRPMDQGYDPQSKYAQYDVRMACEENMRKAVHTFCISTTENSRSDMEIMFPHRRFVILEDIHDLPRVLPRLYVQLTV